MVILFYEAGRSGRWLLRIGMLWGFYERGKCFSSSFFGLMGRGGLLKRANEF